MDDSRDLDEEGHICTSVFVVQENTQMFRGNEELVFFALLIKRSNVALGAFECIGVRFIADRKMGSNGLYGCSCNQMTSTYEVSSFLPFSCTLDDP
jgi:hypothetical protein